MDIDLLKYTKVIHEVGQLIDGHFKDIYALMSDKDLQQNFEQYNEHKKEHANAGFNIFSLISDKYHYENLHSDIIATFLDNTREHNEKNKFLELFIKMLQKIRPELKLKIEDFENVIVDREKYKIDILIH